MNWIVFLEKYCFRKMDSTTKAMLFAPWSDAERVLVSRVSCNDFFKLLFLSFLCNYWFLFLVKSVYR